MKKLTLTVASLCISGFLLAQEYTPPVKAVSTFEAKYPEAIVEEWYEGYSDVECYFENDGWYGSAHFDESGKWLFSEFFMDESELPKVVTEMLEEDFPEHEISEATFKETADGKMYEVTIYNEATEDNRIVTYNAEGKLIDEAVINMDDDSFE